MSKELQNEFTPRFKEYAHLFPLLTACSLVLLFISLDVMATRTARLPRLTLSSETPVLEPKNILRYATTVKKKVGFSGIS